jgi:A/G-specific adenine glycosylase
MTPSPETAIRPPTSPADCRRLETIRLRLLAWYAANARSLPWRGQSDPYAILVSEYMLQQTGVDRVEPAYRRFLERFPTFEALARAARVDVLRAWAGLGYNRRAIHLQECARQVVAHHAGRLPSDVESLRHLPGVGPYTLAAIRSFVFREDVAALDTNVRRVVQRLRLGGTGDAAAVARAANELVPKGRSADWNQALMDFGSVMCTAKSPACLICPLRDVCAFIAQPEGTSPARKIAEPSEPYVGSRRYYRGRIVACLRDLSSDVTVSLDELLRSIKPEATPDELPWLESLLRALADEGLARLERAADGLRVGPPL